MQIHKHYFDVIDERGNAIIVYGVWLRYWGLTIPYAAVLFSDAQGEFSEKSVLQSLQVSSAGAVSQPRLGLRGYWRNAQVALANERLWDSAGRVLDWQAHTLGAECRVNINGIEYEGLGYGETLSMTIAPWRLPLSQLYWGRFLSATDNVVWIEWRGAKPQRWLFHNGRSYADFTLTDEALGFGDGIRLTFDAPVVIKDAPLLTLAQRYPFLRLLVKPRFWRSRERKYKSRARLSSADFAVEGWALYEQVIWEK